MKRVKLFGIIFLIITTTKANVLTVSNDANKPAQYSNINTAFAAAAPGDTIYVYGGSSNYGDLTINKSITLIGNGFNPRKETFFHSNLNDITLTNNTSNVTLDGITFHRFIGNASSPFTYNNITIRNCLAYMDIILLNSNVAISCGGSISNWLIQNCIIHELHISHNTTCVPVSPVTSGILVKNSYISYFQSNRGVQLVNCHFGNEINQPIFFNNKNNNFDNCIFWHFNFQQDNSNTNNVFRNCLTYQTLVPSPGFDLNSWTGGASGTATGCIINQNPLFVTNPNFLMSLQPAISARVHWDPVLQPGSPAANAGTDGTNIGIGGGTIPWVISGEPNIPVIRKFQLINTVVPSNGTVTLKATATKAQ